MHAQNSDDEQEDPEFKKISQYEECLKRRIYFSERVDKIERCLFKFQMINSTTSYCSDYEIKMFTEAIADKEVVCKILNEIAADAKEEVWFDFYRKTTS